MDLNSAIAIMNFLGNKMTEAQASELLNQMKGNVSIAEMEYFLQIATGPMFAELSQYNAEMGGLGRY